MESERNARGWPSVQFARLDLDSAKEIARFIVWLCDWGLRGEVADHEPYIPPDPEALVELLWAWNGAPKKRMAKLLWQLLVQNDSQQYFDQSFTVNVDSIADQISKSAHLLQPIQQNLVWVLDALIEREREDITIGQGSWGEEWWLPAEQAAYLRDQLRRARPDLIEASSSYEDSMQYAVVPFFEIVSADPLRSYSGNLRSNGDEFVEIEDSAGVRWPLSYPWFPFSQRAGNGFSWGYPGGGPSHLALAILADAVGGDFEIAERLREEFLLEVLADLPRRSPFQISRTKVLTWAQGKGVGPAVLSAATARVAELERANRQWIEDHKARLKRIRSIGGLSAQRFDLVPSDFECALYLDLMEAMENGGWVLRCSRCNHALPCPLTPTGNRQRARWMAGRPVYHEDCFVQHRLEHKRSCWKERTKSAVFRAQERARARTRRRIQKPKV